MTEQEAIPLTTEMRVKNYGTREEVWNGTALKTKGKLSKEDLVQDEKTGRLKSRKLIERGKNLFSTINQKKVPEPIQEQNPEPIVDVTPLEPKKRAPRSRAPRVKVV